jgi:hypothetical protein
MCSTQACADRAARRRPRAGRSSYTAATPCEHTFVTAQGSPLTRLRRALAGGDLLAARTAAAEIPQVGLDEAVDLILLIAHHEPTKLDAAAVRFLGRACLERSFITLTDAQFLLACLAQLERADPDSRAGFAAALRRLRLEHAARRIEATATPANPSRPENRG